MAWPNERSKFALMPKSPQLAPDKLRLPAVSPSRWLRVSFVAFRYGPNGPDELKEHLLRMLLRLYGSCQALKSRGTGPEAGHR